MTYRGGGCRPIALICIGDVCVRRTTPGATQNVSDSAFAGWSSAWFSAVEVVVLPLDLGPLGDAVAQTDEHVLDRALVCDSRWATPRGTGVPGSVTSTASSRRRRSSSTDDKASPRAVCSASSRLAPRSAPRRGSSLAGLERGDTAEGQRDGRRAPEHGDARLLELVARRGARKGASPLPLEPIDVVHAPLRALAQGRGLIGPAVPPCLPAPHRATAPRFAPVRRRPDRLGG